MSSPLKKIVALLNIFSFIFCSNLPMVFAIEQTAPLDKKERYEIEDASYVLRSPNGYNLSVRSVRPKISLYVGRKFPAVLRLSGGWGSMIDILSSKRTKEAASRGIIFVAFDSPMRRDYPVGSPQQDYKGFKEQDDVAAVLKSIIENVYADINIIGICTHSSGAILAAGVLGREEYEDLSDKVAFFIDAEGPDCAKDIIYNPNLNIVSPQVKGNYRTEEDFWHERRGSNFIGNYKGIYQRLQAKNDHALGNYYQHAAAYLNTATRGKARWTRLNKQPKNQIYKSNKEPSGVNMGDALDLEKLEGSEDRHFWNLLFEIIKEIKTNSGSKPLDSDGQ
jgi:hypothetical protein